MTDFELRAEARPTDPDSRNYVPWHLVRFRSHVGMCGHPTDRSSESRPLTEVDDTAPERRCTTCWEWWSLVRLVGEPRGE